jgi:hypothetical protein
MSIFGSAFCEADRYIPVLGSVDLVAGRVIPVDSRVIPVAGRVVLVTGRVVLETGRTVPVVSESPLKLEKLSTTVACRVICIASLIGAKAVSKARKDIEAGKAFLIAGRK